MARQQQADSLERFERARAFQRNNLLELQQSLQDAMRFSTRAQMEDEQAFRQSGEWGKTRLSEEVSEGARATNARLMALNERVADDSVRASVKSLREKLARHSLAGTREQAEAVLNDAMNVFTLVMEQIGTTLRGLY
jgi:NTP pyrophosphatase (non-canonical NTP hydrolase)